MEKTLRAYKVKLYPTAEQTQLCYQYAGYARFAYNWGLAYAKTIYDKTEKFPGWMDIKKQWNAIKYQEFEWTVDLLQRPAEEAIRDLGKAFQNFWRDRQKENGRKAQFPRFKSRYSRKHFRLYGVTVEHSRMKLPGLGWVRFRQPGYIPTENIKYLGISLSEEGGMWFASVQVEEVVAAIDPAQGEPIGVDLGIKALATVSDGRQFDNPATLRKYMKRLKRLQRRLSRQTKGSANYRETKRQVARLHFKIASIRSYATHSATSAIVGRGDIPENRPRVIALEDLNVAGMMKNHHLAGAVADANMAEMRRQIEYKAEWYGSEVVYADRFYASSKTCSECGAIDRELTLSERTYRCDTCGAELDRDVNAARNLARLAL